MTLSPAVRNLLIILVLAGLVVAAPGGDDGAYFLRSLLSIGISVMFVLIIARVYRERRMDLYGLGDQWRGLLYAALGGLVFVLASSGRLLNQGGGAALLWLVLLGAVVYAFVALYQQWRRNASY